MTVEVILSHFVKSEYHLLHLLDKVNCLLNFEDDVGKLENHCVIWARGLSGLLPPGLTGYMGNQATP